MDLETLEELPKNGKLSPASCLGFRCCRPLCFCCGGSKGIRRAWRKSNNSKPKKKDHGKHYRRHTNLKGQLND